MDVCFWLDIAINFRTAYYAGEFGDELVSEWRWRRASGGGDGDAGRGALHRREPDGGVSVT